jgi:hypothetical protein
VIRSLFVKKEFPIEVIPVGHDEEVFSFLTNHWDGKNSYKGIIWLLQRDENIITLIKLIRLIKEKKV